MAFNFNPVLSEIQGHIQSMSPDAQAVVAKVGGNTLPSAAAVTAAQAPSVIPQGMLLPHPDAGPEPAPISMGSSTPSLSMPSIPSAPPQLVTGPNRGQAMMTNGQPVSRGTTLGDTVERGRLLNEGAPVDNIYHNITNSDFGQNHPLAGKLLGGLAEVGGKIGDTLANAAPGIAREIPGTTVRHNMLLNQANAALGQDLANAQKEAEANSENATAGHLNAETAGLENPQPEPEGEERPYTISTDKGELQWDGQRWTPIQVNGETVNAPEKPGAATRLQKVEGADGTFANYDPVNGVFTDQSGKVLPNFKAKDKSMQGAYGGFGPAMLASRMLQSAYNDNPALLPYLAPLLSRMLSEGGAQPGLTEALGKVPTGQPQNDQGTPIGLRQPEAPTGATRNRGQFAEEVLPTMHDAATEIDKVGDKLGPFMGRISDLVTGKIGAYGPEFSALQTDLHNIATGWGRLHGNSVETMKQFYDDLNASKDPANLKAKLERYEKQAETYKEGGAGRPGNEGGAKDNDPLGIR